MGPIPTENYRHKPGVPVAPMADLDNDVIHIDDVPYLVPLHAGGVLLERADDGAIIGAHRLNRDFTYVAVAAEGWD